MEILSTNKPEVPKKIQQAGAFQIIMENEEGKTVVMPTKMIADKEIIIESGPEPEIPEKRVERAIEEQEKERQ